MPSQLESGAGKLHEFKPVPASWLRRDVLLFANSIGCSSSDLHFLYERHARFAAFPTYPIVLTFKHAFADTIDFDTHFNRYLLPPAISSLPNLPVLDSKRVVDGERTIEILETLPTSSHGRRFEIQSNILEILDKGEKGTVVHTEHLLVEREEEKLYTRMTETAFYMGQVGWGGPKGRARPKARELPARKPTATYIHDVSPTAHLLYRLNGDYNPLHATECPEAIVQPTPIMHGLYTWNSVCRGILSVLCNSDPAALKAFGARFASPVRPGDSLETDIWICDRVDAKANGNVNDGGEWHEVRFVTRIRGGRVCLSNGSAVVRCSKPATSKL